jgi:hypothetical protein
MRHYERLVRLQRELHRIGHLIDEGIATVPTTDTDPVDERAIGVRLFNQTWDYLEVEDRTPDDDDRMLHCAHASAWHWAQVGGPEHRARSEWQISRVYTVLGRGEPALFHARRCLEHCEQNAIGDWDLAFAYEAMARASATSGDGAAAQEWLAKGRAQLDQIAAQENRDLVAADLDTVPI